LIVILPALFGGLWQVIELSRMSFSFMRFFSVGQIIPDGLLILLFLMIFLVSTFILFHFWKKIEGEDENIDNIEKNPNILYSFLLLILFLAFVTLIIYANNYFINNIESLLSLFFYLPVNITLLLFSYVTFHYSILHCSNIKFLYRNKKFLLEIRLIPAYTVIFMFLLFTIKFHDVFMLPIKLKNVDNLICKMEKVDEDANFEILYSNDKYIFIECYKFVKDRNGKPTQSQIRIFKFEDLLDDTSCIGNKRIRTEFVRDSIWDSKKPAKLEN